MPIGSATVELEIPASKSLKDKRRVVKSIIARLRQRYNLSVAEVDTLEDWHRATIVLVTVANDANRVHSQLEKAMDSLETWRLDCIIAAYAIEIW
jgi:uncharacterized protein YlxP (DUF503 family)